LAWETEKYFLVDEIADLDPEILVVGGIGNVRNRLKRLGIAKPSIEIAYSLDFGIDENNIMKLVEVNDGHSLGSYGISAINYAKFLSARWQK
jgi:hypothetical protein